MTHSHTLNKLLDQASQYHPLYGDRLANHLPMVLTALYKLGADDKKLELTYGNSISGLNLMTSLDSPLPIENVNTYLGQSDRFTDYLDHFQTRIDQAGSEAILKESLPVLLPGLAASAFHAPIRLAYAIETANTKEIAMALAYWSTEFQSFELNNAVTGETLEEILTRLAPLAIDYDFSPGIIVDRMNEIAELIKSHRVLLQPTEISLLKIAQFCIKAFAEKNDFTLLHTVTGCHAFRLMQPYIDHQEPALRELWKAIVVAYLSTRHSYQPTGNNTYSDTECDFQSIMAAACESSNAHVIKIVYSCWQEYTIYEEPLYYSVAKRAVG